MYNQYRLAFGRKCFDFPDTHDDLDPLAISEIHDVDDVSDNITDYFYDPNACPRGVGGVQIIVIASIFLSNLKSSQTPSSALQIIIINQWK